MGRPPSVEVRLDKDSRYRTKAQRRWLGSQRPVNVDWEYRRRQHLVDRPTGPSRGNGCLRSATAAGPGGFSSAKRFSHAQASHPRCMRTCSGLHAHVLSLQIFRLLTTFPWKRRHRRSLLQFGTSADHVRIERSGVGTLFAGDRLNIMSSMSISSLLVCYIAIGMQEGTLHRRLIATSSINIRRKFCTRSN